MYKRVTYLAKRVTGFALIGLIASTCVIKINAEDLKVSTYDISSMLSIYKESKDTLVVNDIEVKRDYITRNFSTYRKNIEYIVVHDTDNRDQGANTEMHTSYYQHNSRGASAHYTVDDSSIVNNVREEHSAYHVGDGHGMNGITNSNSIGIEMCVNSDGDYNKTFETTQELVKYLMNKYDIPPKRVVMHRDASGKNCSRKMIEEGLWDDFKRGIGDKNYGPSEEEKSNLDKGDFSLNDDVDLYKEGSWTSEILGKLESGTRVKLLSQDSQWSEIELITEVDGGNGNKIKHGYVVNTSLENKEEIGKGKLKLSTYLRVNKSWSSAPYDIIINANDEVKVYDRDDEWTLVVVDGTYGYVSSDMLDFTSKE